MRNLDLLHGCIKSLGKFHGARGATDRESSQSPSGEQSKLLRLTGPIGPCTRKTRLEGKLERATRGGRQKGQGGASNEKDVGDSSSNDTAGIRSRGKGAGKEVQFL